MKIFAKVIDIISWFIGAVLAARVLLKFLAANPTTPFVAWIYEVTRQMVMPFNGIFPSPKVTSSNVLEIPTIFALVVYVVVGYFLAEAVESLGDQISLRLKRKSTPIMPSNNMMPNNMVNTMPMQHSNGINNNQMPNNYPQNPQMPQ